MLKNVFLGALFLIGMGLHAQVALLRLSNEEFVQFRTQPEALAQGNWGGHADLQWFDGLEQLKAYRHSSDLKTGNYVCMYLQDEMLLANFFVKTPFQPSLVLEGSRIYLTWLDEKGEMVSGLQPKVGKRRWLKPELDGKRFLLRSQYNFKSIELHGADFIDFVRVSYSESRNFNHRYNPPPSKNFFGYIATNKPTYRLGDTLKIKVYAQFEGRLPVNIPAEIQLKKDYRLLKNFEVKPIKPGVFGLEVVLSDSMDLSNNYELVFNVSQSEYRNLTNKFALQQYQLDEGKLDLLVKKSDLVVGDTLEIQGMLQDEVGNPLPGASVSVLIMGQPLFFNRRLPRVSYFPDTLLFAEIPTDFEGHYHLKWATRQLPKGITFRLRANAKATLPSGKLLEKTAWAMSNEKIEPKLNVARNFDQICISHPDSGKARLVHRDHDNNLISDSIVLPYCFPSEPMVAYYEVERGMDKQTFKNSIFGSVLYVTSKSVEKGLEISIINPHKVPVNAKLVKIGSGINLFDFGGDTTFFLPLKPYKSVELYLQYINFGQVEVKQLALARAESRLEISTNFEETGWPGQQNTAEISVLDFDAKPVSDVDLTVIGYNALLPGDNIPRLPDYSYKPEIIDNPLKWSFERNNQKTAQAPVTKKLVALFQNRDTLFYDLLLESDSIRYHYIPLSNPEAPAEFAVYPIVNGQFVKPVYVSYKNKVVYFHDVDQPYSFPFPPRKAFDILEVRLGNQKVSGSINIPMKEGYKTVFSLQVPEGEYKKLELTDEERKKIADSYMFFQTEDPVLIFDFNGQTMRPFKSGWDRFAIGPLMRDAELPIKVHNQRREILHLPVKKGTTNQLDFNYRMVYATLATISQAVWFNTKKLHIDFEAQHYKAIDTSFFYTPIIKDHVMALGNVQQAPSPVSGKLSLVQSLGNYQPVSNPGNSYLLLMRQDSAGNWLPYLYKPTYKHPTSLRPGRYIFIAFEFERGAYKVYKGSANIIAHQNNIVKIHADRILNWWEIDSAAYGILQLIEEKNLYDLHQYFDEKDAPQKDRKTGVATAAQTIKGLGVRGTVRDKINSETLPFCNVIARKNGVIVNKVETDLDGNYWLPLEIGIYELEFSFSGYITLTAELFISSNRQYTYSAFLVEDNTVLNEVVVNYEMPLIDGVKTSTIKHEIVNMPVRDVNSIVAQTAGVYSSDEGVSTTVSGSTTYFVDGVQVRGNMELVEGNPDSKSPQPVPLSPTSQVLMAQKGQRTYFTESAIWQPYLATGSDGKAQFDYTWPGNIAPYETHILGVHRNFMTGQAIYNTKVYKVLQTRLYQPRYLIAGDSIVLRGAVQNLTSESFPARLIWHSSLQKDSVTQSKEIQNFENQVFGLATSNNQQDSIQMYFGLSLENGYFDGEQRKMAVLRKGALVHRGFGSAVFNDTLLRPTAYHSEAPFVFSVHNKTQSLALNEAVHLSGYLHSCNEQLSARLVALEFLIEKESGLKKLIRMRERDKVLKLLKENQQSNGGWSWWGKTGTPNLAMTLQIWDNLSFVNSKSKKAAELLAVAKIQFPSWLQYAQNYSDTLEIIQAGLRMGLDLQFDEILDQTPSNMWQQLMQERIKLEGKRITKTKTSELASKTNYSSFIWQENTPQFARNRNQILLTQEALSILIAERADTLTIKRTLAGLMELRNGAPFFSTIHSVRFLRLMEQVKNYLPVPDNPPTLVYENKEVTEFPFVWKGDSAALPVFELRNQKHFLMVNGYQEQWELAPQTTTTDFSVKRQFSASGKVDSIFKRGSEVQLGVAVTVRNQSSYLMLEVSVPAGMYVKTQSKPYWANEVAYFDDKVVFYIERLPVGSYKIELPLIAQYGGRFTANPVAFRSMYLKHLETFTETQTIEVLNK